MRRTNAHRTPVPRLHLNVGPLRPVALVVTREEVQSADPAPFVRRVQSLMVDREAVWQLRGQLCIVVGGYDSDTRELVDVAEVRAYMARLCAAWPQWAYFLSRIDNSIPLLLSCTCADVAWGGGQFSLNMPRLAKTLADGYVGMNQVFEKYGFAASENSTMTQSVVRVVREAWG